MLSIVIPVYNEEESLPSLYSELQEVLSSLNIQYEIIFINDGS
ncbi:MAG: glycosyltransferase, partial [Candidatus Heimdallarchaeaceae archaeon]